MTKKSRKKFEYLESKKSFKRSRRSQMFADCRRPATLLKKRLQHRCFPVKFAKFLRTPFFSEHLCWLLLTILI